jgi:GNAT superfamily N-acetyltransferase
VDIFREGQLSIRLFTEDLLDATDAVVMAAYQATHSRKERLRRYLNLQPDGSFVALLDETVVGFGAMMEYGRFDYVGLMAVRPDIQKRGIGAALLEQCLDWAHRRQCPTLLLDATPAGFPLYQHYGFVEEDQTVVLQQTRPAALPHPIPDTVAPLTREEFPEMVSFDTAAFGAERRAVLVAYCADDAQRVLVARDASGYLCGYLIAQADVLGPWVARTVDDAEHLLLHALALPFTGAPSVFVSAQHHQALAVLARAGFTERRRLSHMRKGQPVQRSRQGMLYGQTSLGLG